MTHLALFAIMLAQQYTNCTASVATTPTGTVITTTCPPGGITVPPLKITTPINLPGGTVGQPYSISIAAIANPTGGVAPYTYTATSLPPGLTLSSAGILSGVRTSAAAMTFSFTVTDSETSH